MESINYFNKRLQLLLAVLVLSIGSSYAQSSEKEGQRSNEFKVNGLSTIIGYAEVSYERILSEESSLGISTGFSFDDNVDYNFGLMPYYRFFFGKKRASGFFVEANGAIYSESFLESLGNGQTNKKNNLGVGLGLAIGNKFVTTKSGFVGEIFAGAGRNFNDSNNISEVYPRIGISLGKRF
ncbi:MAG: DUF3575 domain-containing protein [bacterium]